MKKTFIILLLLLVPTMVSAQTYFDLDFSGGYPPTGWTMDAHNANWSATATNNAGGSAPELEFNWSPSFVGQTHFISPEQDLTGVTQLKFEFKHMIDHYGGPYSLGVATRSGGGAWNTAWSLVNPTGSVGPESHTLSIETSDVGASDFQICFFFNGDSYNINFWYLDDAKLFTPMAHDAQVSDIVVNSQYDPGVNLTPTAIVENFGLNPETFDAHCEIFVAGQSVYTDDVFGISLDAGVNQTIEFMDYTLAAANDMYEITVTVDLVGDMNPDNDTMTKPFNTYTTPRDKVLLEIGTGTWCVYCPGAALGAHDMITNGHEVAVVEYHNGDSYVTQSGTARIAYYGISGYPTSVFDGVEKIVGGSANQSMYPTYLPIYQDRIAIKSAFTIEIFGTNVGNDYDILVRVTKMANHPWENIKLHFALTESNIPENWFIMDTVDWAERLMAPNANGTDVDLQNNDVLEIPLSFTRNPNWVLEELEVVAFLQNVNDKEILQGAKVHLPELQAPVGIDDDIPLPSVTTLSNNYPNPFNASTQINYSLSDDQDVSIKLFDILGRELATLVNERKSAGDHSIRFDASELGTGVYFYRMETNNYSETKKMTLIK